MRGFLVLSLLLGTLVGLARPAHADDGPDPCESWAAEQAWPYLLQAYAYTPYGLGGAGWGPLLQSPATPFGPGPIGPATLFAPPGAAPGYGPAGPATLAPGLNGTLTTFGNAALSGANTALAAANIAAGAMGAGQAAAGASPGLPLPPFLPGRLTNLTGPGLNPNGGALTTSTAGATVRQLATFQVALTAAQVQQSEFYALNQRYVASGHAQTAAAFQRLSAAQTAQNTFDDAKAACQAQLAQAAAGGAAAASSPPAGSSQP